MVSSLQLVLGFLILVASYAWGPKTGLFHFHIIFPLGVWLLCDGLNFRFTGHSTLHGPKRRTLGMILWGALFGLFLLIYRRISKDRILATTSLNDFVTLGLLLFVVATGFANVISGLYEHFDILTTIAPWLRGIVTLTPDPTLMLQVPLRFKIHILGVLALLVKISGARIQPLYHPGADG